MKNAPRANKNLGQHYLKDPFVISQITTLPGEIDLIIEIGPGPATLTRNLKSLNLPLIVIEKDRRFDDILLEILKEEDIFYEDALHFDWNQFIVSKNLQDQRIWLVSNLPYNISSLLFISFLKVPQIKFLTLMFQKEVADKICPPENVKNPLNSLMCLGQSFFDLKRLIKVSRGAFMPPPKVESLVLWAKRLDATQINLTDFSSFEAFCRCIFRFKRKIIYKNLLESFLPEKIQEVLKLNNLTGQERAESLDLQQVIKLYKTFHSN